MSKKYLTLFLCVIIILIVIFISIIVFSNTKNNIDKTKNKVDEEINYVEDKLIGIINSLNNIPFSNSILLEQTTVKAKSNNSQSQNEKSEQSDQSKSDTESKDYTKYNVESENILIGLSKDIDWNYIKDSAEELYTTWTTIIIDLHSLNIKNEDILNFSRELDNFILNVEKEDKKLTLVSSSTLYSYLPIYLSQYSQDSKKINITYTKLNIINSYVLAEDDNWDEMQVQIIKAQENFGLIINSINADKYQNSINKTYILLNEMRNVISLQDKTLYYLKYKNLMENAMNI